MSRSAYGSSNVNLVGAGLDQNSLSEIGRQADQMNLFSSGFQHDITMAEYHDDDVSQFNGASMGLGFTLATSQQIPIYNAHLFANARGGITINNDHFASSREGGLASSGQFAIQ